MYIYLLVRRNYQGKDFINIRAVNDVTANCIPWRMPVFLLRIHDDVSFYHSVTSSSFISTREQSSDVEFNRIRIN